MHESLALTLWRQHNEQRHRSIVNYLPLYLPSGDSKDEHRWWTYLFIDLRAVATCTCPAEHNHHWCAGPVCSMHSYRFYTCHIAARLLQLASLCVVHMRQSTQFGVIFCDLSCSHVASHILMTVLYVQLFHIANFAHALAHARPTMSHIPLVP